MEILPSPTDLAIYHQGPPLGNGPLPTFVYFALNGKESLTLDPYNQPILCLSDVPVRCFSFTLPFHQEGRSPKETMLLWAKTCQAGTDFFTPFFEKSERNLDYLIQSGFIDPYKIAVGGLSRGAWMASHLAARDQRCKFVLGFAPVTDISYLPLFSSTPAVQFSLHMVVDELSQREVKYFIGNRDVQVGTECCFALVQSLVERAYARGVRSPPIELVISPSIGHKGHGTSLEIFREGAHWLKTKFK